MQKKFHYGLWNTLWTLSKGINDAWKNCNYDTNVSSMELISCWHVMPQFFTLVNINQFLFIIRIALLVGILISFCPYKPFSCFQVIEQTALVHQLITWMFPLLWPETRWIHCNDEAIYCKSKKDNNCILCYQTIMHPIILPSRHFLNDISLINKIFLTCLTGNVWLW